jgi:pimeloyl-ACP methyl ester carboxylesterase
MRRALLLPLTVCVALCGCTDDDNSGDGSETGGAGGTGDAGAPPDVDDRPCDAEPERRTTPNGVEFVRTPDACFEGLAGWPYEAKYVEIDGLRQAYVDEGPADGPVVLLLHGQPSWGYLYRKMIPVLVDAGMRTIAMDHLGTGRSDKPTDIAAYTYLGHNERLLAFMDVLELNDITVFVQDWGSLIGLRVAGLNPDRFARIAVGNGALPDFPDDLQPFPTVENPDQTEAIPSLFEALPAQQVPFYDGCDKLVPDTNFGVWMNYAMKAESFHASEVIEAMTWFDLPPDVEAAYDAPFPSRIYMAGIRTFPSLVNEVPGTTAEAWEGLRAFERPLVTLWASNDPGNLGACTTQNALICGVPGAAGQPHARLDEASHFLQDDQGAEIARRLVAAMNGDASVVGNYEADCDAGGDGGGGAMMLPVADDGTGTVCSGADDCSGLEADVCVTVGTMGGFCSVEGCEPGGCAESYTCCRDCSPVLTAQLGIDGPLCFPEAVESQLTGAAGCTCE